MSSSMGNQKSWLHLGFTARDRRLLARIQRPGAGSDELAIDQEAIPNQSPCYREVP